MLQINILFTLEILSMIIKRYSIPIEINILLDIRKNPNLNIQGKENQKRTLVNPT